VIGGRRIGHREVPPDVTTGRVVVVVGGDVVVVVVVVGTDVVGVVVPDPAGDPVVGVVVAGVVAGVVVGVVVEVDGTEVEVLPVVVLTAELAPGCSFATTKPMSAVAPAAPTIEARVTKRTRALARRLASGELRLLGWCLIGGIGPASWSPVHTRTRESRQPQRPLWAVCEMLAAKPFSYPKPKKRNLRQHDTPPGLRRRRP
jgi:hypothetical protein